MPEIIIGLGKLERRFAAISGTAGGIAVMNRLTADTISHLKRAIPRKTSHTGRTIAAGRITARSATISASRVAKWLDEGTGLYGPRHRRIVPVHKKALSWMGGTFGPGGSLRLSGRRRSGKAGRGASRVTVRSTKGMRARPFIDNAVKAAARRNGVMAEIVKRWDSAA